MGSGYVGIMLAANHTQWSGVNHGISCYGGANNSPGNASCLDTSFMHPNEAHNAAHFAIGHEVHFD
jgi:hypothetical protein